MDLTSFRETVIKPKLVEAFGGTMASNLVTSAIVASMKDSGDKQKAEMFVDAICSNPKVVGLWGAAQARKQRGDWLAKA